MIFRFLFKYSVSKFDWLYSFKKNSYQSTHNFTKRHIQNIFEYTSIEFKNGIKTITLADEKTRNSLSSGLLTTLIRNITDRQTDRRLRVIVIAAKGPVFCSGHNLRELTSDKGTEQQLKVLNLSNKLMNVIIDSPVPIICKVDGLAAAGGCQLVAQSDMAFCTEQSTFGTPGVNFGLISTTALVALARCVPKKLVLKMALTGNPITSREAELGGLVTKVCENANKLDEEIDNVCEIIKSKSRDIVELGKDCFYMQLDRSLKAAYEIGTIEMVRNLQLDDTQEGIRSFLEKREPRWN